MRVLWYLYWTVALGSGVTALFLTLARRNGSGNEHLGASVMLQAAMFVMIGSNFLAELNWYRPLYADVARISSMLCLSLMIPLLPSMVASHPRYRVGRKVLRPFMIAGGGMFLHYILSAALFYTVRYDGMNRYFSGFRIIPAYAVFLALAAAMVFVSVSILTVDVSRIRNADSHRILRRLAVVQLAFLPFMVMIDQLRFFFPLLWSIRPEERLIVFPLFYVAINVCLVLYARSGGYAFIPPAIFRDAGLTPREEEVARLLGEGASYKDVAEVLCVTLSTVQTHVKSIYRKTRVNSKYDLINAVRGSM